MRVDIVVGFLINSSDGGACCFEGNTFLFIEIMSM